jgi:3-hydroxyisobutyrate dehydrogenase-like beta-hydroxyacid dehydrogenase
VYLEVAEESLLPQARAGQVFIDHSTVPAPETRRLATALGEKGAIALDVPVSGWITGAESGTLTMFVGGDEPTARHYWPLFEVLGDPQRIFYGGAAGMGQVMKIVQQLKDRLIDVARMEVMAFGRRAGLGWEQILQTLNVAPDSDDGYARLYRRILAGEAAHINCIFGEWPYYLAEAGVQNIPLPMLESIFRFFDAGERVSQDEQGRPTPSLWDELMTRDGPTL